MKKLFFLMLIGMTFANSSVIKLGDNNYERTLKKSNKTVVMFYASWCGACRSMKPEYVKLANNFKGKTKFALINVDEHTKVSSKYNIRSIPTTIIFNKGKEVSRYVGSLDRSELMAIVAPKKEEKDDLACY